MYIISIWSSTSQAYIFLWIQCLCEGSTFFFFFCVYSTILGGGRIFYLKAGMQSFKMSVNILSLFCDNTAKFLNPLQVRFTVPFRMEWFAKGLSGLHQQAPFHVDLESLVHEVPLNLPNKTSAFNSPMWFHFFFFIEGWWHGSEGCILDKCLK